MSRARSSAGDTIPTECRAIEVRVAELRQLFNAIDPSPFRDRDLDPRADEFIVEWARDLPRDARLALVVHLERGAGQADEAPLLESQFISTSSNGLWTPDGGFASCFGEAASAW